MYHDNKSLIILGGLHMERAAMIANMKLDNLLTAQEIRAALTRLLTKPMDDMRIDVFVRREDHRAELQAVLDAATEQEDRFKHYWSPMEFDECVAHTRAINVLLERARHLLSLVYNK